MNLTTILIIINVFTAVAIIALTLMQTSKGDMGSAFGGGGGSQSMFGSRGSANFLSRMTSAMCAIFFITSLSLAYLYSQGNANNSVIEESVIEEVNEVPSLDVEVPVLDESGIPTLDVDEAAVESVENAIDGAVDATEAAVDEVPVDTDN